MLRALGTEGHRASVTLAILAGACWPKVNEVKAGSWARNSLRKLVRGRLVEKEERGTYIQTDAGRVEAKRSLSK